MNAILLNTESDSRMKQLISRFILLAVAISVAFFPFTALTDTEIGHHKTKTLDRIASRSGPGTEYDGAGSYHSAGFPCTAISRSFDEAHQIWWIQIEFKYGKSLRRVYTGVKRLDMHSNAVPTEALLGYAVTAESVQGKYGPGSGYADKKYIIQSGTTGGVYIHEKGYVLFEYSDMDGQLRRAWIPENCLEGGSWTGADHWSAVY